MPGWKIVVNMIEGHSLWSALEMFSGKKGPERNEYLVKIFIQNIINFFCCAKNPLLKFSHARYFTEIFFIFGISLNKVPLTFTLKNVEWNQIKFHDLD